MYGSESEDEDDALAYLSDDDDLDKEGGAGLLASLRRGAFPPEMRLV